MKTLHSVLTQLLLVLMIFSMCLELRAQVCGTCTEGSAGLVITELSYNPSGTQGSDSNCEYVELFNSFSNSITISTNTSFTVSNGLTFVLPAGTTIMSGEYILLADNPTNIVNCAYTNAIPIGTQIFDFDAVGGNNGLTNETETLEINLACSLNTAVNFMQSVTYTDSDPNLDQTDGGGDAVFYPLGGAAATQGTPSPGTGNCVPCSTTEFLCIACPDFSTIETGDLNIGVTESECTTVGGTTGQDVSGSIIAPSTSCPMGSSLEYSLDNFSTAGIPTAPTYDDDTTVTVSTRCTCDTDNSMTSSMSTVTTMPGICPLNTCNPNIPVFAPRSTTVNELKTNTAKKKQ